MNIKFSLVSSSRQDLRVIISHCGGKYKKSIGISTDKWNQKTQKSGNIDTDTALKKIRIGLESTLDEFSTREDIIKALDRIKGGKWYDVPVRGNTPVIGANIPSFKDFFYEWSERESGAKRQNKLTYNVVKRLIGVDYSWRELDSAFYTRLIKKMDKEEFRANYQGVLIGRIKTCLNEAYALHYIDNCHFREWKKPRESTFAIALSDYQVEAIENFKTERDMWKKIIDLFILGIHTASRFSDYSRLSLDDIQDNKIRFVQEKTENTVVIPCSPIVREVLERNGGKAPYTVDQVYNREIKKICKEIGESDTDTGFCQAVQVPPSMRKKLGKKDDEPVYRYELVTSHTCRRTAITKLYRQGVSPSLICRISGHKTESQLLKYIKISADDAVLQLAELDFFK